MRDGEAPSIERGGAFLDLRWTRSGGKSRLGRLPAGGATADDAFGEVAAAHIDVAEQAAE